MEKIRIKQGETRDYVSVSFLGEELAKHDPSHHDDTRGTTRTLYRTEDDRLILHTHNWTKWQGEKSRKRIEETNLEMLKANHPKLAEESGLIDALSLDEAL